MSKVSRDKKKKQHKAKTGMTTSPQNMLMDVEFGTDFVGEHKRAAEAVQTRVKSNAQRYGMNCDCE